MNVARDVLQPGGWSGGLRRERIEELGAASYMARVL